MAFWSPVNSLSSKERAGAMHQAAILIAGAGGDALTMEARVNNEAEQAPSKHLS